MIRGTQYVKAYQLPARGFFQVLGNGTVNAANIHAEAHTYNVTWPYSLHNEGLVYIKGLLCLKLRLFLKLIKKIYVAMNISYDTAIVNLI